MTMRRRPRTSIAAVLAALIVTLTAPLSGGQGSSVAGRVTEGIGRECGLAFPAAGPSCRAAVFAAAVPLGEALTSLGSRVVDHSGTERSGTDAIHCGALPLARPRVDQTTDCAVAPSVRQQHARGSGRAARPPPIAS